MRIKIVLTGGPSGGKTTLLQALQKDLSMHLSLVPEAASILYRGGFPRRSHGDPGKKHTQRAIYFTQKELESLCTLESTTPIMVCDRGSLDSIAYWPGSEADFFENLQTTKEKEIARYDWVLHLDTASEPNFDTSNVIRTETHKEALELNEKIMKAWSGHPRRIVIPHEDDFLGKMTKARGVIQGILSGWSYDQVKAQTEVEPS